MSNGTIQSSSESVAYIASLCRGAEKPLLLSVREDICFGNEWLCLGNIALKPDPKAAHEEQFAPNENAVRLGYYEWRCKKLDTLQTECLKLMQPEAPDEQGMSRATDKIRRALHSIIDVAARLGLLFPRFDPDMIACMPFHRPTTVIADTNAVGKGGVDFLVRFLCPVGRLKVPAIVAMEILNQSDKFFAMRRESLGNEQKPRKKAAILLNHVVSQANQRAMLRFELHSDIEVERTQIFSDPLRNAFTERDKENQKDWPDLNLAAPVRGYCDRLIMETARQHLSTVAPGHPVMLMTGDEGLARMALAEGVQPLFFHAGRSPEVYGQMLAGTRFHPFTGEVFSVPLQGLLWELAVTFGSARLASEDGSKYFEVRAIDQDLSWQPFHARDDLLRVVWHGFELEHANRMPERSLVPLADTGRESAEAVLTRKPPQAGRETAIGKKAPERRAKGRPKLGPFNPSTVYRFDLTALFEFIPVLLEKGVLRITCEGTPLRGKSKKTISKYLGFLTTGRFITEVEGRIQATESLQQLLGALTTPDVEGACNYFRAVPSLDEFLTRLHEERRIEAKVRAPERERPSPCYLQIAELCGYALQVPDEAIYGTFHSPSARDFVDLAVKAYESIRKGEDYVLTGLWLETLARENGVHPITTRARLAEAQAGNMVERYTQGSTPDTRFENHTMTVLEVDDGRPKPAKLCLYHGDFIIPGKASVSIRLKRK